MTRSSLHLKIKTKFIACELSVQRDVTFGVVLCRAKLHIGSSIRYKNNLFGNKFLQCNKVKRVSIIILSILSAQQTVKTVNS